MAEYFSVHLGGLSTGSFSLEPYNDGGPNIIMNITGIAHEAAPTEIINALIIPHGHGLSDTVLSGYLKNNYSDDISQGIYYSKFENTTDTNKLVTFPKIVIQSRQWENTQFDLYWLQSIESGDIFNKDTTGIYSFPHNIQPNEVVISGQLTSNQDQIKYQISWSPISNEGSLSYGALPTDGPYILNVKYTYPDTIGTLPSGWSGGEMYYASGNVTYPSGIYFNLPYYDPRDDYQNVPANYTFILNNNVIDNIVNPGEPGSKPLEIKIDHATFIDSLYKELDSKVPQYVKIEDVQRTPEEIEIKEGIIDRRRLSIGINDIAIQKNTYSKGGVFISNTYVLDYPVYTFSLSVDEFIPEYENIDKFDIIKYYVEFNGNEWLRISPTSRLSEMDGDLVIPKMFIMDKAPDKVDSKEIKYLSYDSSVNSFRIRIIFDLSDLDSSNFIPPEVREFRAIAFDKNQFLNIEG